MDLLWEEAGWLTVYHLGEEFKDVDMQAPAEVVLRFLFLHVCSDETLTLQARMLSPQTPFLNLGLEKLWLKYNPVGNANLSSGIILSHICAELYLCSKLCEELKRLLFQNNNTPANKVTILVRAQYPLWSWGFFSPS